MLEGEFSKSGPKNRTDCSFPRTRKKSWESRRILGTHLPFRSTKSLLNDMEIPNAKAGVSLGRERAKRETRRGERPKIESSPFWGGCFLKPKDLLYTTTQGLKPKQPKSQPLVVCFPTVSVTVTERRTKTLGPGTRKEDGSLYKGKVHQSLIFNTKGAPP